MIDGTSGNWQPTASIVVVSYNTADHIEACLQSLLDLDYPRAEIIVVDNASDDGSAELVRSRFPSVTLIEMAENKGFAGGANAGLNAATGEIVATVNPDARLDRQWLSAVARALAAPGVGVVGSKILYPDGKTIQHAGGVVHYPLATTDHTGRGERDRGQYDSPAEASFVTGAALALRREVGQALGYFDTQFFPVYFEDVDLCWRARQTGLQVLYEPRAVAYHKESVVTGRTSSRYYSYFHVNRLRFVVKQYTPEQVMLDFLPAEAARVAGDMQPEDRKASMALLDNRQVESDPPATSGTVAIGSRWRELQRNLDEVAAGWQVYEKSRRGRQRSGVRGHLQNILSRWYTWPIVQKQIEYNASVTRSLRDITRQLEDLEARVAVESFLSAAYASRQRGEVAALRAQVERLCGEKGAEEDRNSHGE